MLSKNKDRKNKGLTRDDSCLKFKMKENVMTGRVDENCDSVEEIDSPANLRVRPSKPVESRFKKMNQWIIVIVNNFNIDIFGEAR